MNVKDNSACRIPETFCPDQPRTLRHEFWEEAVTDTTTRIAKMIGDAIDVDATPTGFREAWTLLARDRPDVPAHECTLRRRLIRTFFHDLVPLLPTRPEWL